jgi:hypothetical protein
VRLVSTAFRKGGDGEGGGGKGNGGEGGVENGEGMDGEGGCCSGDEGEGSEGGGGGDGYKEREERDWVFFLYKKRLFSIQDIIIYHYISRFYHCVSLCIIVDITIYHVPRRHMISMIAMIHNTRHDARFEHMIPT